MVKDNIDMDFDFEKVDKKEKSKFDEIKGYRKDVDNETDIDIDMDFDEEKQSDKEMKEDEENNKEEKHVNKNIQQIEESLDVEFSGEQRDIIDHTGSPLSVVSCAGSGKTTVLVSRMVYRELEYKIKPLNMLAITFTSDAAHDMAGKYRDVRRKSGVKRKGNATFKTFHALFLMLLKSMDGYKNMSVVNSSQYKYLLSKYVKGSEVEDKPSIVDGMFGYRGAIINRGMSKDGIENAESFYSKDVPFNLDNYIDIMQRYQEYKDIDGVIDFDDMQTLLYKEIVEEGNKEPVKAFQRVWGEGDIYIDEYQDISKIQRDVMDELIKDFNRLSVIGDDDQAIYSFRGSDPKYILDFKYTYHNAEVKYLSTNYRCAENILDKVIPLIENNQNRMEKEIQSFQEGGEVKFIETKEGNDEVIQELLEEVDGLDTRLYEYICLLVRNNSQRMLLSDELIGYDIPIDITDTKFSLQENKFYNTLFDIIDMVKEEDNKLFLKHFKKFLPHVRKSKVETYLYNDANWYVDIVEHLFYNVQEQDITLLEQIHETNNMYNALVSVWKLVKQYYKDLGAKGFGSYKRTQEVMKYVLGKARGMGIEEYMEREERKYAKLRLWCGSDEALKINTIHSVKGLEFESVYMIGMNGMIIPDESRVERLIREKGSKEAKRYIEEERRLFYVAWTRAIGRLIVSYDKRDESRFIKEIRE